MLHFFAAIARRHPLSTQVATGGVIAALGDQLMQRSLEGSKSRDLDWERTARFVAIRIAVVTPCYFGWISLLERVTLTGKKGVFAKVALDSLVWTPSFQCTFFLCMGLLEGFTIQEGCDRAAQTVPMTMPASWLFWIPLQTINFWLIPIHYRVTWVNGCSVVWTTLMSGFNEWARNTQQQAQKGIPKTAGQSQTESAIERETVPQPSCPRAAGYQSRHMHSASQ